MADFDDFTTADTGNSEKDLVAEFLSREHDTLAELGVGDDEFGKIIYLPSCTGIGFSDWQPQTLCLMQLSLKNA
jgi:hypothetical protein